INCGRTFVVSDMRGAPVRGAYVAYHHEGTTYALVESVSYDARLTPNSETCVRRTQNCGPTRTALRMRTFAFWRPSGDWLSDSRPRPRDRVTTFRPHNRLQRGF